MNPKFAALSSFPLKPGTRFVHPPDPPELVRLDSPAVCVMTDFKYVHPVTVSPDRTIDDALNKMKTAGVRLLLVTNESGEVIGIITAKEIMGEQPIRIVEETRVQRSEIYVSMIMTAQPDITVLNNLSVLNAQVGEIIETLRRLERQHILVVETDVSTRAPRIIGMFSTSHISKLLGRDVTEQIPPAHSLAEIVQQIG
jgi:CBS-domain-containing membrane protein